MVVMCRSFANGYNHIVKGDTGMQNITTMKTVITKKKKDGRRRSRSRSRRRRSRDGERRRICYNVLVLGEKSFVL
jgi:hypothetical protein